MKEHQLNELLRLIAKRVVAEYMSMKDKKAMEADSTSTIGSDPNTPPEDAMSPALKARMDREKEIARRNNIKTKEAELKTAKSKMDMQKRETDQVKRFTKPGLERDIQRLKGAG
jgi:hypothetical protein